MTASAKDPLEFDFAIGFKSSADRIVGEKDRRLARAARQMPYHHPFLDDCLRSIMPRDLILLGAYTGVGKTELARSVAMKNAASGKNVHYFALEAEEDEIEMRGKYTVLSDLVYRNGDARLRAELNYSDWYRGRLEDQIGALDGEADRMIAHRYKTLHTYYRGRSFAQQDIARLFQAIQDQTDLIVLDHLHYIDIDDDNENRGMRALVAEIRNVSLLIGRPVILVVHLRKRVGQSKSVMPSIDDVHGSSEITKICTHSIMLARAPRSALDYSRYGFLNTFFSVPKDRVSGATDFVAMCPFDWRRRKYDDSYTLGRLSPAGDKFEPLGTDELPSWAKHHEPLAVSHTHVPQGEN